MNDLGEEHCYHFRWPIYLDSCARLICQGKTKVSIFCIYIYIYVYTVMEN